MKNLLDTFTIPDNPSKPRLVPESQTVQAGVNFSIRCVIDDPGFPPADPRNISWQTSDGGLLDSTGPVLHHQENAVGNHGFRCSVPGVYTSSILSTSGQVIVQGV